MPAIGAIGLYVAALATLVGIVAAALAVRLLPKPAASAGSGPVAAQDSELTQTVVLIAQIAAALCLLGLTAACAVLLICFLGDDNSIQYVAKYRSDSSSPLAALYKVAGLWAGREGSLLFWAWLIGIFNMVICLRGRRQQRALDMAALLVAQLVLAAFLGVLVFSETNNPFALTPEQYLNSAGMLTGAATLWGMNPLLEHWAMAIHPPTLFVGYAGLTAPFAYAIAALIVNDPSTLWVKRAQRFALISWLFLGLGIGLGAVWAYVVLGWGGYWGWDPVENASLLSWLVCVALLHSLTVYRQRGIYKRWSVMCAAAAFAFVIVGTFISRSGIVQSVHAFEGDPVSLALFGVLIVASMLAAAIGLLLRPQSFAPSSDDGTGADSFFSRDIAYYLNNVVMMVSTVLIAYLTISSALPAWLPFGGMTVGSETYNAIARPLGVLYCLVVAVCPMLSWARTDAAAFLKAAKLPAICAAALFALLLAYFIAALAPAYSATVAAGGAVAEPTVAAGPAPYYFGLTIVGFLAASLLVFNSLFMLLRTWRSGARLAQRLGGFAAHLAMGVILIGLIGSSMYVSEHSGYMAYDIEADAAAEPFTVGDYSLEYVSNDIELLENGDDIYYSVTFDVYRGAEHLGQLTPAVQLVQTTQQQKQIAAVMGFPTEDLFVVYRGVNDEGAFSLDVRINPLISLVWLGFALLMLGTAAAAFGPRAPRAKADKGSGA